MVVDNSIQRQKVNTGASIALSVTVPTCSPLHGLLHYHYIAQPSIVSLEEAEPSPLNMSVLIETSLGDLVVDLEIDSCPRVCENFLKLCKIKYYGLNAFFNGKLGCLSADVPS
jgi:hypothetical protein